MSATQIKTISLKHEAIIDYFVLNPLSDLASASANLGYSVPYLSILMNSNLFKSELDRRRGKIEEIIETDISAHVRMMAIEGLKRSVNLMQKEENLSSVVSATEMALKAAGFGPPDKNVTNNQTVVVSPVSLEALQNARANFGKPFTVVSQEIANVLPAPESRLESTPSSGEEV